MNLESTIIMDDVVDSSERRKPNRTKDDGNRGIESLGAKYPRVAMSWEIRRARRWDIFDLLIESWFVLVMLVDVGRLTYCCWVD